jgi:hypothetical protein
MPHYTSLSFGGGHIPQSTSMVGGLNPPSYGPNTSFNFPGWSASMQNSSTSYIPFVIPSSIT